MKLLKNMFKNLLVSVLNTLFTVFILYWNVMTIINAFKTPDADWTQVFTYLACSVVILLIMWFMAFLKFIRNFVLFILVLLLVLWCCLPQFLPNVSDGMCMTLGSCNEGVEVKTVSGKIMINSQTCKDNGWSWDENKKTCKTHVKKVEN